MTITSISVTYERKIYPVQEYIGGVRLDNHEIVRLTLHAEVDAEAPTIQSVAWLQELARNLVVNECQRVTELAL